MVELEYTVGYNVFVMNENAKKFLWVGKDSRIPTLGETCHFIYDSLYRHFNSVDKECVVGILTGGLQTSTSTPDSYSGNLSAYDIIRGHNFSELLDRGDREGLAKLTNFCNQKIDIPHSSSGGIVVSLSKDAELNWNGPVDYGYSLKLSSAFSPDDPSLLVRDRVFESWTVKR